MLFSSGFSRNPGQDPEGILSVGPYYVVVVIVKNLTKHKRNI